MTPEPRDTVWISGQFVDTGQITLPVASLTLTQGLGAYETLRLVGGRAPWLDLHTQRLARACRAMQLPGADHDWDCILAELSRRCRRPDARVRITVGDGFCMATCGPLPEGLALERAQGVQLRSHHMTRPDAEVKAVSRWPLWRAEQEAGGEVLLLDAGGGWLESSRANLFVWRGDDLYTPPTPDVLPGICRAITLQVAATLGLRTHVGPLPRAVQADCASAFLTNAVRGIRPVVALNERRFPIERRTRELQSALDARMGLS